MTRRLHRRAFLGGASVMVGLPFLEAMLPRGRSIASAAADTPRRLVFVHVPNGMIRTGLKPSATGANYAMPRLMQELEDVRGEFSILTGIHNKPGQATYTLPDGTLSEDGAGDHARDVGTFLTATRIKKTDGDDFYNGISVDQEAANYLKQYTPALPSLELATRSGGYGGDSGYGSVYQSAISWSGPTTPVAPLSSPGAVFDRLFAGFDPGETAAARERRLAREQSILDAVVGDIQSLETKLNGADRAKLDAYFSGIRHLETRLQSATLSCDPGVRPGTPEAFDALVDAMFELIQLAFACDRTRVVTLMLSKGGTYDFLNVDGTPITQDHHSISHLEQGEPDVEKIETINHWQMLAFGRLLRALNVVDVTDGDGGTFLRNSLVLFGGGLDATGHDPNDPTLTPLQSGGVHRHNNLPLFLAGRGGGDVVPGRHIDYGKSGASIASLYLAMLHNVGHMAPSFGLEGAAPLGQLAG